MLKIEPLLLEHAFQEKQISKSELGAKCLNFLCDFIFWPQNVWIYIHEPRRSQFSLQRKRRPWDFSRWGDHPVSPYFLIGHTKPYLGRRCCCQSWTTKKVCTDFFNGPSKLPNLASVSLIGVVTTRRLSSATTVLHPVQHKNKCFSWLWPFLPYQLIDFKLIRPKSYAKALITPI